MPAAPDNEDNATVNETSEYRLIDALACRFERALDLVAAPNAFSRLEEIAALCDEAAVIARGWPSIVRPSRPWS